MNPTLAALLTASVLVIAGILVLIVIFSIPVLLQARRTAHEAEKLMDTLRLQIAPVSHDVAAISQEVKSVIQSIHRQVNRVESGIEAAHEMALHVKAFQTDVQRRIEDPLVQLAAVLLGVKRGVESIAGIFSR